MANGEYNSAQDLMRAIARGIETAEFEVRGPMKRAAELVQHTAQEKLGTYQAAAGAFPAWAPLAEATKADRARKGYPDDEPLLRDGTLRAAIEVDAHHDHAFVGVRSKSSADGKSDIGDIALYLENGTSKMPPRPFLGAALHEKRDKVGNIIAQGVFRAFRAAIKR